MIRTIQMNGKLLIEIVQGIETVRIIEAFLIFPMAAFHLAIMSGRIRTNELMPNVQLSCSCVEKGGQVFL